MADEKVPFKKSQVKLALSALLAHGEKEDEKKNKSELFKGSKGLWLMFGLRKIPRTEIKPRKIPLPHPLHKSSEVCFISTQPGKVMKKTFEEKGVTNIQKVISLTKLRKEYKTFELKRQLLATYDAFLCEEKIYHLVVKALGKECYKKKKEPIPVRMRYDDWKSEIAKCLSSTPLRIGHGPCSAVIVGDVSDHSEKELNENLLHAMRIVGTKMPGQWKNIKSIHIKTSDSVALPVYQASPLETNDLPDVQDESADKNKPKRKRKKVEKTLKNTDPDSENTKPVDETEQNTTVEVAKEPEETAEEKEKTAEIVEEIKTPKKKRKVTESKTPKSIPAKRTGPKRATKTKSK